MPYFHGMFYEPLRILMMFIVNSNTISHITMFHTPRTPYVTCNYFRNLTKNQYIRPYILLHTVPTFLPIPPPPPTQGITRYYNYFYSSLFILYRLNRLQFRTQTAYPKLTCQVKCHSTVSSPQCEQGSSTMWVRMHNYYPDSKNCYSLSLPPVFVLWEDLLRPMGQGRTFLLPQLIMQGK